MSFKKTILGYLFLPWLLLASSSVLTFQVGLVLEKFDSTMNAYGNEDNFEYRFSIMESGIHPYMEGTINPNIMNHISHRHKRAWSFLTYFKNPTESHSTPYCFEIKCQLDFNAGYNYFIFYPSLWRAIAEKEKGVDDLKQAMALSYESIHSKKMELCFDISNASEEQREKQILKMRTNGINFKIDKNNKDSLTIFLDSQQRPSIHLVLPITFVFRPKISQMVIDKEEDKMIFKLAGDKEIISLPAKNSNIIQDNSPTDIAPLRSSIATRNSLKEAPNKEDIAILIAEIDTKGNRKIENTKEHVINSHLWLFPEQAQFTGFSERDNLERQKLRRVLQQVRDLLYTQTTVSDAQSNQHTPTEKLQSLGFIVVDSPKDHYCMYHSVSKWLENHRHPLLKKLESNGQYQTGISLYHYMKDQAQLLHKEFPNEKRFHEWAKKMPLTSSSKPLWGTDEMLFDIILPAIDQSILLLHISVKDSTEPKLAAHYFKKEASQTAHCQWDITDSEILDILETTRKEDNHMILLNSDNHWQLVIPSKNKD